MADFKNYDPGEISVSFKGLDLGGFFDGTFVSVERDEDTFAKHTGAKGDVTRVRNRNRGGKVTVVINQASPTNDRLSTFHKNDEKFGTGVGVLLIKDSNGFTVYLAKDAWLTRPANGEFGKDAQGRTWVFDCAELEMFTGGSIR